MVKIPKKYLRLIEKKDIEKCLNVRECSYLFGKFINEEYELDEGMILRLEKSLGPGDLCRHQRMDFTVYEKMYERQNLKLTHVRNNYKFLQYYVREGREKW